MAFYGLTFLIQIALVVHVFRTGRPVYWAFIIFFLPAVGAIAYFIVELLPDLAGGIRGQRAIRSVKKALNPGGEYPDLLLGLAEAQFGDGRFEDAQCTLERLNEKNPEYRSGPAHLLYARTLQKNDDLDGAEHEYAAVAKYFTGAEANVRYARLLEELGKNDEALTHYEEVLLSAELAPRHYRKAQRKWIGEARESAKRLLAV